MYRKIIGLMLTTVAISAISIQAVYAQPLSPARSAPSKVGDVPVANVLHRLGAKLEGDLRPRSSTVTQAISTECLTYPAFLGSYPGVEAVHRDYASKGVKFYYVYRALAHPENNGIVKPFSLKERLMHIGEAQQRLKTQVPWLADNMNNDFKRTIGNANNSEFVLDLVHNNRSIDGPIFSCNRCLTSFIFMLLR